MVLLALKNRGVVSLDWYGGLGGGCWGGPGGRCWRPSLAPGGPSCLVPVSSGSPPSWGGEASVGLGSSFSAPNLSLPETALGSRVGEADEDWHGHPNCLMS